MMESAWTSIALASAARAQGLEEVAIMALRRALLAEAKPSDSFNYIKEQVLTYMRTPGMLKTALDVVNNVNIDFFDPAHKAELFQIKV